MVMLKWRLTGGFWVEDQDGNKLGRITRRLFGPKYIIKNPQGDTLGYTDICVHKPRNPERALLENTEYILTSALNKKQLAKGLPAYNENIDLSTIKALYIKPPLADRMTVYLSGRDITLFLRVKMDGSAMITGTDQSIYGKIKRMRRNTFSIDLTVSKEPVLLCGIFLFIRYLLKENEPLNIV